MASRERPSSEESTRVYSRPQTEQSDATSPNGLHSESSPTHDSGSAPVRTGNHRKHQIRAEWGFADAKTAAAMLKRAKRMAGGKKRGGRVHHSRESNPAPVPQSADTSQYPSGEVWSARASEVARDTLSEVGYGSTTDARALHKVTLGQFGIIPTNQPPCSAEGARSSVRLPLIGKKPTHSPNTSPKRPPTIAQKVVLPRLYTPAHES
eukprot:m.582792 g.582792  ORF g.582792 m.582792 type:complete len:208 (+) comp22338_c0_seq6:2-625(+)